MPGPVVSSAVAPTPKPPTVVTAPPLLPDLLASVTNGVGDDARWTYAPLAQPLNQHGIPLYSFRPPGGISYADTHHYYFTSSMPVVTGMTQNNGIGGETGFRSAWYGYSEAMYNHLGRGFQGFRTITEQTNATDTGRQVRTTTTYSQKFPLTGKVEKVERSVPAGTVFERETDTWICGLADRSACPYSDGLSFANAPFAPVLDKRRIDRFDLNSGLALSHTETVNAASPTVLPSASGWDANGNLVNQVVTSKDDGADGFVSHTVTKTNTYDPADTTNWWLDKLNRNVTTTAITYASAHPFPGGGDPPTRTVTTTFQWNSDRTPLSRTVQPGDPTQQLTLTYGYPTPSYGLPTSTSISGALVAPSPRTTNFSYTSDGQNASPDGYFVLTTTNAANHVTTTQHSTLDGQVTKLIDPNNLTTVNGYDALGHRTGTDYKDANGAALRPSASYSYARCSGGPSSSCAGGGMYGEDGNQAHAAWSLSRVQAGYPTTVDWFDALGRTIKHVESGFDGTAIETFKEYDEMNAVVWQSTPFLFGTSGDLTGWTYDRLNRPLGKNAPGNDADRIDTSYTYTGATTAIKVRGHSVSSTCSSSTNLCMDMSRSYDVLGRLEKTVQNNGGTQSYATTNYWYDGAGNPLIVAGPDCNPASATCGVTAAYNDVGQRTQMSDPDAGTWNFTYDALGEVLRQTDARGVYTDHTYDALGRLIKRTATNSAATAPNPQVIRDNWGYDPSGPSGGNGLLGYARRSTGQSTTSLLTPIWNETNSYDAATKRLMTIQSTLDGQTQPWVTSVAYDPTYGYEQKVTYPSGLAVTKGYTGHGELRQLSNDASNTIYWTATAQDAWGNLTSETYTGNITGSHVSSPGTGQITQKKWTNGTAAVDEWDYIYDTFGNVKTQSRSISGGTATMESYTYDGLQRLTQAARANVSSNPPAVSYNYTASGNLDFKSDFSTAVTGAYQYGTNSCGPHAVSQVARSTGSQTYVCDANGNVVGGSTLSAAYDFNNQPWQVTRARAGAAQFEYTANGDVFKEQASSHTTLFGPRGYEESTPSGGQFTQRHELGPVLVLRQGGTDTVQAVLRDRLGSQVLLTTGGGGGLAAPTLSIAPSPSLDGHYTVTWIGGVSGSTYVLKEYANGVERTVYTGSLTSWSAVRPVGIYAYYVEACNGACSPFSATVTEYVTPNAPASPSTSPNPSPTGAFIVTWGPVNGATSYLLEEQVGSGSWVGVSSGSPATSWPTSGRANGTYVYRVHACITPTACSAPSAASPTETVQTSSVPSPPASISVAPNPSTDGSYTVTWSAPSTATSYTLQEFAGGNWSPVPNITGASRSFSLRSNGTYGYRAQACNANGCSDYSPTATETVNIPAPPSPPSWISASPNPSTDGNYTVTWGAVLGTGITYQLEESLVPSNIWVPIPTALTGTSWSPPSAKTDGTWGYRVKACQNGVCGLYSDGYPEVVAHAPDVPSGLKVTPYPSTGHFTVSWAPSATATYYWLEEQVNGGAWAQVTNPDPYSAQTSYLADRGSGSYAYHVKACSLTTTSGLRCSAFTADVTEVVQGSARPLEPASISTDPALACTTPQCTYTISWAPVAGAQTYELHTTTDVTGIDMIDSLDASITSKGYPWKPGKGNASVLYSHEVRACVGVDPTKLCSPYRGPVVIDVGQRLIAPGRPQLAPPATAYDAFGAARNGDFSDRANGTLNLLPGTLRGFTGHNHVDDVWLIHMNGRIYDYQLGRFLSVDPIIQNPANSQSLNPYSYILNNPLAGKDPTGYATCDVSQTVGSGAGECKLDSGSDNKVFDGDKYLGKITADKGGVATSFTATKEGFSYQDAHKANGANVGQTPTGEPARSADQQGGISTRPTSTVSDATQHLPYGLGVDPYSDLNLDQQAARWMAPGVGFAQCATGDVACSGQETAKQAAIGAGQLVIGKAASYLFGKVGAWWAGSGAEALDVAGQATSRVGRWMSPEELGKMQQTGTVQEGSGGMTRVANPASPNTYRNAPSGDVYVEFNVPSNRVLPHSNGTGRIPGPNSPDARVPGRNPADYAMPPATNIKDFP
ncbi:RHS repeat-associated core domain-containing protein [Dokdonella soli]